MQKLTHRVDAVTRNKHSETVITTKDKIGAVVTAHNCHKRGIIRTIRMNGAGVTITVRDK